jgi:hypothetical protein
MLANTFVGRVLGEYALQRWCVGGRVDGIAGAAGARGDTDAAMAALRGRALLWRLGMDSGEGLRQRFLTLNNEDLHYVDELQVRIELAHAKRSTLGLEQRAVAVHRYSNQSRRVAVGVKLKPLAFIPHGRILAVSLSE